LAHQVIDLLGLQACRWLAALVFAQRLGLGDALTLTYTAVPPGSGVRMGVDRDRDTLLNGAETGTGVFVSASDTGTSPAMSDTDGDGFDDGIEVASGTDPNNPLDYPGAVPVLPGLGGAMLGAILLMAGGLGLRKRHA